MELRVRLVASRLSKWEDAPTVTACVLVGNETEGFSKIFRSLDVLYTNIVSLLNCEPYFLIELW